MTVKMCPECHWPVEHREHATIHSRLKRYPHTVNGVEMLLVRPWDAWREDQQRDLLTVMEADRASMLRGGYRMTLWHMDNFNDERNSMRHWFEGVPV